MKEPLYRIQQKDGRKWYDLKLEDMRVTCDSDARQLCEMFARDTGGEYRAKRGSVTIYDTINHQFDSAKRFERYARTPQAIIRDATQKCAQTNEPTEIEAFITRAVKEVIDTQIFGKTQPKE